MHLGILELSIIFAISWWMVFLPILGAGTQSQADAGDVIEGTEAGAPVEHMLPKKALWATIAAAVITVIVAIALPLLAR